MRRWMCVPMIALCLLTGCGSETAEKATSEDLRTAYQSMSGCRMEAEITCCGEEVWTFGLRCTYLPEGDTTVEVLSPEIAAGVTATLRGEDLELSYGDLCLPAGTLSSEQVSPLACLPRMMEALREGWLLEENREIWQETACLRLTLDRTGEQGGKLVSTLWLREADGMPLRGELAVDGEIILTAEFTSFEFCDTIDQIT